jgi:hypothetical protein
LINRYQGNATDVGAYKLYFKVNSIHSKRKSAQECLYIDIQGKREVVDRCDIETWKVCEVRNKLQVVNKSEESNGSDNTSTTSTVSLSDESADRSATETTSVIDPTTNLTSSTVVNIQSNSTEDASAADNDSTSISLQPTTTTITSLSTESANQSFSVFVDKNDSINTSESLSDSTGSSTETMNTTPTYLSTESTNRSFTVRIDRSDDINASESRSDTTASSTVTILQGNNNVETQEKHSTVYLILETISRVNFDYQLNSKHSTDASTKQSDHLNVDMSVTTQTGDTMWYISGVCALIVLFVLAIVVICCSKTRCV